MEPNQVQEKTNGALIGSVIIIVLLIIGGIYLWKTSMQNRVMPPDSNLSQSGSTADMEASLNSMDLDSMDSDI